MQLPPMYSAVKINGQPLYKGGPQGPDGGAHASPHHGVQHRLPGQPGTGGITRCALPAPRAPTSGCWPRISAAPWACRPRWPRCAVPRAGVFTIGQCHTLSEILAAAEAGTLMDSGWILPGGDCVCTYAHATPPAGPDGQPTAESRIPFLQRQLPTSHLCGRSHGRYPPPTTRPGSSWAWRR